MKNVLRGLIACILPCGALDVVRIVHTNGRVEEISGSVKACEIMKANPKHVLKKPSSYNDVPRIVIVHPDADLQRGKIYFLMPLPPSKSSSRKTKQSKIKDASSEEHRPLQRNRRNGKIAVWRPNLDSISESPIRNYALSN